MIEYEEFVRILDPELCRDLWERTYDRRGTDVTPVMLNIGTHRQEPLTVAIALGWANRLAESVLR